MRKCDNSAIIGIPDGAAIKFYVLCAFMVNWIGCNLDGTCVVSM